MKSLALLYISSTLFGCAIACFPIFLAWGIVEAGAQTVEVHPTSTPHPSPAYLKWDTITVDAKTAKKLEITDIQALPQTYHVFGSPRLICEREPIVTKEAGRWVITFSENKTQLEAATPRGQAQR